MPESTDFPEPREAGSDRRDNVASAGLDPDAWDRLEEWRVSNRLARSEAVRRLIRTGLDAEERNGWYDRAGRAVVLGLLMGYPTLAAARGSMTVAAGWIGAMLLFTLLEPYLTGAVSGFVDTLKPWE